MSLYLNKARVEFEVKRSSELLIILLMINHCVET
jgi:hypothetical protein